MITEKVIIVGIVVTGIVLMCLIGSVCDVIKKKGDRNNERKNDDNL
jgi:hypothetical protein